MDRLLALYIDLKTREEGQGMVEYALLLVFVAAVAAAALSATAAGGLGDDLKTKLDGIIP